MDNIPSSRDEAIRLQSVCYFDGIPCCHGHIDKKYTNTKICYQCKRDRNKRYNKNNPDTAKKISKRTYNKHKAKCIARSLEWSRKNRDKSNAIKRKSKAKHKHRYAKIISIKNKERRIKDPFFKFKRNIKKAVWESSKENNWTEKLMYPIVDLAKYIESKFDENMTWDNYGSYWEIDHIKPISKCSTFIECWSMENLQPLSKTNNRQKANRYKDI